MQKPAFFANFTRAISAFPLRPKKSFQAPFIFELKTWWRKGLSHRLQIESEEFAAAHKDHKKSVVEL